MVDVFELFDKFDLDLLFLDDGIYESLVLEPTQEIQDDLTINYYNLFNDPEEVIDVTCETLNFI